MMIVMVINDEKEMKNNFAFYLAFHRLKHSTSTGLLIMEQKHRFSFIHKSGHLILLSISLAGYYSVQVHQQIPLMLHGVDYLNPVFFALFKLF